MPTDHSAQRAWLGFFVYGVRVAVMQSLFGSMDKGTDTFEQTDAANGRCKA
jgi:hypothetical protein